MKTIEYEKFEAWLMSKQDEETYNYASTHDCLMCRFVKETTKHDRPGAGGGYLCLFYYDNATTINYPNWLIAFEQKFCHLTTFGQAKRAFREMFPEKVEAIEPAKQEIVCEFPII